MPIANPKPMHPGRVLTSVFMEDNNLNQTQLAQRLGCTPGKINEIVNGKRGITPDFAVMLEREFNLDAAVWVRMQAEYDLHIARGKAGKKKKRSSAGGSRNGSNHPLSARGAD